MPLKFRSYLWAFLPGTIVFLLSENFSFFNPILGGLILGILMGNFIRLPQETQGIVHKSGNRFLEFSVIFLAFGINYLHITKLGWEGLAFVFSLIIFIILLTFFWSKTPMNWMIGFGTAICGTSAIAALTPILKGEKKDAGVAMAVVNLFGMIGMILFPLILVKMNLKPLYAAWLIGGSLHSVGNVAGSGYMVSDTVGELSVTIKMVRVSLLSFGLIFFNFLTQRQAHLSWKKYFKLPWYIWGFLVITVLVSLVSVPEYLAEIIDLTGKLFLTLALTNIGLQIRFKDLIQSGKKGLAFGLGIWICQLLFIALYIMILGF